MKLSSSNNLIHIYSTTGTISFFKKPSWNLDTSSYTQSHICSSILLLKLAHPGIKGHYRGWTLTLFKDIQASGALASCSSYSYVALLVLMLIPMNSKFKKKKVQESSRIVSYDKVCAKRTFPPPGGGMICHTWYKSLIHCTRTVIGRRYHWHWCDSTILVKHESFIRRLLCILIEWMKGVPHVLQCFH